MKSPAAPLDYAVPSSAPSTRWKRWFERAFAAFGLMFFAAGGGWMSYITFEAGVWWVVPTAYAGFAVWCVVAIVWARPGSNSTVRFRGLACD